MYQWVNPTTGRSQMSGKPPAWYRGETGGPRVLVFEKNELVDDTAVAVGEDQRLQLRNKALHTIPSEKENALSTEQAVATLEAQIQAIVDSPAMEEYLKTPPAQSQEETNQNSSNQRSIKEDRKASGSSEAANREEKTVNSRPTSESSDERVERLKALISAWDENKTEEAKLLLESEIADKPEASSEKK